jgi:protein involved in polysaccharide export with SLBB domain
MQSTTPDRLPVLAAPEAWQRRRPSARRWARPWPRLWARLALPAVIALVAVPRATLAQGGAGTRLPEPPIDTIARPTGTLRSGDLLKVRVYRDSELSGQYLIDAQGNVQIPGVGVVRAAGLDPTQISERLVDALRGRGFRSPEIAVQPLIRVSVLGEVRTPGLYPVDPGVSLIQLLTLAGGPTEHANLKRAQVLRDDRAFTVDMQSALAGSAAGRVGLYSNDVVYVPPRRSVFSRENVGLMATLASLALSVVTLIQVTHR